MIERAELAGGRLRLVSRQGRGSCVMLRFAAMEEHGGHR
jgi:signal transduction histidine kinase